MLITMVKIRIYRKDSNLFFSYLVDSEFYADGDGDEGASSSSSSSTVKYQSQGKVTPNPTPHIPAETEDVDINEHEGGSDAYSYDENSGNETTNPDDSEVFGDTMSNNPSDMNSINPDSNNRKGSDLASTSRIPFISSNLWRDLFTKPGILVGTFIIFFFLRSENKFSFRYYRWSSHWNVICYLTCYVYNLSNA